MTHSMPADKANRLLAELREVIANLLRDAHALAPDVEFVIEARPSPGATGDLITWIDGSTCGVQHRAQRIVDDLQRMRDLRRALGKLGSEQ